MEQDYLHSETSEEEQSRSSSEEESSSSSSIDTDETDAETDCQTDDDMDIEDDDDDDDDDDEDMEASDEEEEDGEEEEVEEEEEEEEEEVEVEEVEEEEEIEVKVEEEGEVEVEEEEEVEVEEDVEVEEVEEEVEAEEEVEVEVKVEEEGEEELEEEEEVEAEEEEVETEVEVDEDEDELYEADGRCDENFDESPEENECEMGESSDRGTVEIDQTYDSWTENTEEKQNGEDEGRSSDLLDDAFNSPLLEDSEASRQNFADILPEFAGEDGGPITFDPEMFFSMFGADTENNQRLQYNEETLEKVKAMNEARKLKLYAHQIAGISILLDYSHTLLADDMGLGKTAQALMAALLDFRIRSVLLIVPPGLHVMWATNIEHWCEKLGEGFSARVYSIHRTTSKLGVGINKAKSEVIQPDGHESREKDCFIRKKGTVNFLLLSPNWLCHDYCSRSDVKRDAKRAKLNELFNKFGDIDMMVVDEIHKYSTGQVTAKVLLGLVRGSIPESACTGIPKVVLLSGTPIRNRVREELGYLGQILNVPNAIKLKYSCYTQNEARLEVRRQEQHAARKAVLGKVLRRTKAGLCKNKNTALRLPQIQYSKKILELDGISIQKYRTIEKGLCLYNSDSVITLSMLQVLRQLAISFSFLKPEWQAKLRDADKTRKWTNKELKELLNRIDKIYGNGKGDDNTCAICLQKEHEDEAKTPFVYFHCTHFAHASCYEELRKKRHDKCMMCRSKFTSREMLSKAQYEELLATMVEVPGSKEEVKVKVPPKFNAVKEYMQALRQKRQQEKLIVFSAFRKPLEGLKKYLDSQGFTSLIVRPNRAADDVAKFKNSRSRYEACLMTLQYAEGFNLDVANHVVFLTLPLSAYEYTQAVDRVFRIGQRRDVHVIDLVTKDTIDEIVYKRLRGNIETIDNFYKQEVEVTAEEYEAATRSVTAVVGDVKQEQQSIKAEPVQQDKESTTTLGKRKLAASSSAETQGST